MNSPTDEVLPRAISFSARRHHGQLRKDGLTPYFAHPVRVMSVVALEFGVSDPEVLAAAVLHDTIEDTGCDHDDLAAEFGVRVADMVATLSKDPRRPAPEREDAYFAGLAVAPVETLLCKAGDTLDNLRDCRDLSAGGRRKAAGKAGRLLTILETRLPPEHRGALDLLRTARDALVVTEGDA